MAKKRPSTVPSPPDCDALAEQLADRLLALHRERWHRRRRQLGYLLMLLGAASGLLTLLVMLWERWW